MSNHEILDNITHQDIKIITEQHPKYGDSHSYATLVPFELASAQVEYPIFFRKNSASNQFEMIALLGLEKQENLFLDDSGWHAHYLPLSIQKRPFLIGFQQQQGAEHPVVHIDMDSPRINKDFGESIFMQHGGQSGYLQEISAILNTLHEGHQQIQAFTAKLQALSLLEPVNLSISLKSGEKLEIEQLFTVHEENLTALQTSEISQLHQQGWLKSIYMIIASVGNLTKLIERKNAKL
jgi:hypothetical protein